MTDLAVVKAEGSPALQLERAGVVAESWTRSIRMPLRPLDGVELERDNYEDRLTLELRQGSSCPTTLGRLDAVWIRYTVLGMGHEQRLPLVDGPVVRCR